MFTLPAAEFLALRQRVSITRNGRERLVALSVEEYRRLQRGDRQVWGLRDLTEADIAALEAVRAPGDSKVFDNEVTS